MPAANGRLGHTALWGAMGTRGGEARATLLSPPFSPSLPIAKAFLAAAAGNPNTR